MPLKTHVDEEPVLNVTSMIDVVLVLTIFFMVATRFHEDEHKIDLKVPSVTAKGGALTSGPEPKVVNVYPDGHLSLSGKAVTLEELTVRLASARNQYQALAVLVRGDKATSHGRMAEVYDACKQAGISELAISVKSETRTR